MSLVNSSKDMMISDNLIFFLPQAGFSSEHSLLLQAEKREVW